MSCRALLDQCNRRRASQTMGNQLGANRGQTDQPHIEHQCLALPGQSAPVQVEAAILQMPGNESYRLSVIAMGQRNPCIAGATRRSRNTWNDLKLDTGLGQPIDFLATATENKRIATFQSADPMPLLRQFHQILVDLLLRY